MIATDEQYSVCWWTDQALSTPHIWTRCVTNSSTTPAPHDRSIFTEEMFEFRNLNTIHVFCEISHKAGMEWLLHLVWAKHAGSEKSTVQLSTVDQKEGGTCSNENGTCVARPIIYCELGSLWSSGSLSLKSWHTLTPCASSYLPEKWWVLCEINCNLENK